MDGSPRPTPTAGAPGTSRLELGIALAVLAIVALAIVLMGSIRARLRTSDAEYALAFAACVNRLEDVRRLPLARLAAIDGTGFDVPAADGSPGGLRPLPEDDDGLPGRLMVTVDKVDGEARLYRVSAVVDWAGSLAPRRFELETLVGSRR